MKYSRKQVEEAIKFWQARLARLNESSENSATPADWNNMKNSPDLDKQAQEYAEKNSWFMALQLAHHIVKKTMDMFKNLEDLDKANASTAHRLGGKAYMVSEDISDLGFEAAKAGMLDKNGYMSESKDVDLTKKEGTIGKVLSDHRDEFMSCQTAAEAKEKLQKYFDEQGINTPKSREMFFKLDQIAARCKGNPRREYEQVVTYLNNTQMSAAGFGTSGKPRRRRGQDEF